jgi:hypothetical protein
LIFENPEVLTPSVTSRKVVAEGLSVIVVFGIVSYVFKVAEHDFEVKNIIMIQQ